MMRHAMQGLAGVAALCLLVMVAQMSRKSMRTVLGQDADWDVKSWTPGLVSLSLFLSLPPSLSLALSRSPSLSPLVRPRSACRQAGARRHTPARGAAFVAVR
jgi:hypothetical protein